METYNGTPVDPDADSPISRRGGWSLSDDDVFPGDVIEWPPALGDPRYIEHVTQDTTDVGEKPLIVAVQDPDDPVLPCTFCSPKTAVTERGIIDVDYELRTLDGRWVADTCHACIADAETVDPEQ